MQQLFEKMSDSTKNGWWQIRTRCCVCRMRLGKYDSSFVLQRVSRKSVRFGPKRDTAIPCTTCTKDSVDKTEQFEIINLRKMNALIVSFSP
jgi:hypothetical protein